FADAREALDLIFGPPGEGVFATSPGHPQDNRPRNAVFYPNTDAGRDMHLAEAKKLAANGQNSFLNSVVWSESAAGLTGQGLVIGEDIQPLSFLCLWVDVDKGLTEKARTLLKQLIAKRAVLTYSGGTTAEGKKKFHLRIPLDEPLTDRS